MIDFRRNPDIYKAFYEGIIDEPFEGSGTIETDESEEASGGGIIRPGVPGFDQETRFKFSKDFLTQICQLKCLNLKPKVFRSSEGLFKDFEGQERTMKS